MSESGKDVNISALLNSFQMGYDKRVRPNYGGKRPCSSFQSPVYVLVSYFKVKILEGPAVPKTEKFKIAIEGLAPIQIIFEIRNQNRQQKKK